MKMIYLKNLTDSKVLINDLRTSVLPYSVTPAIPEDDVNRSKTAQKFIAQEILEQIELSATDANALRKTAQAKQDETVTVILNSYKKKVSGKKPATGDQTANFDTSVGIIPDAGTILSKTSSDEGSIPTPPTELAKKVDAEFNRIADEALEKQKLNEVKKEEQEKKIKDDMEVKTEMSTTSIEGSEPIPEDVNAVPVKKTAKKSDLDKQVEEFVSLKYFAKKSRINKIDDKKLLKALLKAETSDTVKEIIKQKLEELS